MKNGKLQIKDISDQEIIDAVVAFHKRRAPTPDESLAERYPSKLILAKMQRMSDRGILDYGVSLRTAWWVTG